MPVLRIVLVVALVLPSSSLAFTAESLHAVWLEERFVSTAAPCLRHGELVARLEELAARYPEGSKLEEAGRSAQGRAIHLLTLGHGERKVLLWSQMHGDEPSATPALLDLADSLLANASDPDAQRILDELTLLLVPMLNPDGTEFYTRRNAQGIDINRDALNLATPEGRLLKRLRDEHEPVLGFNLHDQNRRRTAGDSGVLATNAVLAVTGDKENTVTPGRLRAKRACAAITTALAPFMPGGMARYDEEWSPRSFGDNLTAWGTPVVLIESGGVPDGGPLSELTRLNFVGILVALRDLALDDLAAYDPAVYEDLPENNVDYWNDVVVRGGEILQPGSTEPYRADLAFDLLRSDRAAAGCDDSRRSRSEIVDVGDARLFAAGRTIDATGQIVLAPFRVGVEGWRARRWLDSDTLGRLAALGVVEVVWSVPEKRFIEAERLATKASDRGRARLRVTPGPLAEDLLVLRRAPGLASAPSLSGVLSLLSRASGVRDIGSLELKQTLNRLWGTRDPVRERPVLVPDRAASFLVLQPAAGEPPSPASELREVWIDGVEIGAAAE